MISNKKNVMKFEKKLKIITKKKKKKKKINSEPVCNEKYLKPEIKSYNGKMNTNFHNNKIPKEGSKFICLAVILIDSVFRKGKNCYSQVILEECKYIVEEQKMPEYFWEDSDEENSNEENSNEENSD